MATSRKGSPQLLPHLDLDKDFGSKVLLLSPTEIRFRLRLPATADLSGTKRILLFNKKKVYL